MSIRKKRTAVSLGVVTLVAAVAVAAFTAGARRQAHGAATALPRNATLYTSGTAWGPFTNFNPLRPGYATGVLGLLYETLFRYDPLKDTLHPVARDQRQVAGPELRRDLAQRRHLERRQAADRRGREVHVRDGQARGLAVLDDVEDGPAERHHERTHRQVQLQGCPELPGLGHQHVLDPDRPEAHLVELQRDRRSRRATPTPSSSAPGRSRTAPARGPHRRCSGTGATAGGRPRRSG